MGFLRSLFPKWLPRLEVGARYRAYAGLRSMVLRLDARKLGDPVVQLANVLGVVVDWSLGDEFATFVALSDGTASMYTSAGGGTIGAGGRPGIDAAAATLLRTAEEQLDRFTPVGAESGPHPGRVRYWALTRAGLLAIDHSAEGPPEGDPGLAALGDAFQEYVTQFRLLDEARSGPN
jgi:hypothetical protein